MTNDQTKKIKKKRAWKSEYLPKVFTVRADEEEHRKLKKMADEYGLSMSRLLVEATLGFGVRPAWEAEEERERTEKMIFEVRRVGINLNQIALQANAAARGRSDTPTQNEISDILRQIETVIRKLKKKL